MAPAPSSIFAQLNIIIDQNGASYCIITPTYSKCVIAAVQNHAILYEYPVSSKDLSCYLSNYDIKTRGISIRAWGYYLT